MKTVTHKKRGGLSRSLKAGESFVLQNENLVITNLTNRNMKINVQKVNENEQKPTEVKDESEHTK